MNNINFVIMESAIETCLSMQSYIDKLYSILEYCDDVEYVDDLISEAYEIYLEATQRRKQADEIDNFMKKNNLGDVNAVNPRKRKQARQLRNTLLQHDFKPEYEEELGKDGRYHIHPTGTIKSDIDPTNPNMVRDAIENKIRWDSKILPRQKDESFWTREKKVDKEFIKHGSDYAKKYGRIKLRFDNDRFNNEKRGKGYESTTKDYGHYQPGNFVSDKIYGGEGRGINVPPASFKRKKPSGYNTELSHEKAHDVFNLTGQSYKWKNTLEPEDKNERGIKHLDEAKSQGKKISSHDDGTYLTGDYDEEFGTKQSPEELEADLHAVKTARVRTKYAGRKRAVKRSGATRNLNDNEIKRFYLFLDNYWNTLRFIPFNQTAEGKALSIKILTDRKFIDLIMKTDDIKNILKSAQDCKHFRNCLKQFMASLNILTGKNIINNLKIHADDLYDVKDNLNTYKRDLEEAIHTQNIDDIQYLRDEIKDAQIRQNRLIVEYKKYIDYIQQKFSDNLKISKIHDLVTNMETLYKFILMNKTSIVYENEDSDYVISNMNKILHEIQSVMPDFVELSKLQNELNEKEAECLKQHYESYKTIKDESTQMRYDFVKKYVHESFEELFNEYYSLDNIDIYLEG